MDIPILYEDDDLVAIDKPAGVVVNRVESVIGETVQDWAERNIKYQKSNIKNEDQDYLNRSGIVHRIDKETSGILLIAKTPLAFRELQQQFKERKVKKTYLALVHGKLVPPEGEIRAPVGRLPWNRERFGIVPGGREAVTKYKIKNQISKIKNKKEELSLVELYPETGRTHQIRVHLAYIHHPIVGDLRYAGRKTGRTDRTWVPRVMLHAWKLSLFHPRERRSLAIEAPIPDDMRRIIQLAN